MSQHSAPHDKPDSKGFFGAYGGQFVPEPVKARLDELTAAMNSALADPAFMRELNDLFIHYTGRPSPVFHCANLSQKLGGAQIWLKREDLNHLGAHKINNTLGQCLLAKRMGKSRIIAETGAGQHGVATAATAALMGLECTICMGEVDMERQHLNVIRMRMLGADVVAATSGQRTLKEAVDEALALWVSDDAIFYVLGSAVGPHPYPYMVRQFQSVVGNEARKQMLEACGQLPDAVLARFDDLLIYDHVQGRVTLLANALPGELGSLAAQWQKGQAETPPVIISADKGVSYETVMKAMDALQKAGVQRVGLSVKQGG